MSKIAFIPTAVTMTSREIAELVESRHDDVKRSIERLAERGVIALPPTAEVSNTGPGPKTIAVYKIGKRDSYVIVAQLSPEFTARLVDRWQELESGAALLPQSLSEALRLAADIAERKAEAEAALAVAAPKVQFVDNYVTSTGNRGFREVCKLLKLNEREFSAWLDSSRVTYRLAGERTAYQCHVDAGRFVIKAGTSGDTGHAYNQLKFTPKGIAWIAGEWAKRNVQAQIGNTS